MSQEETRAQSAARKIIEMWMRFPRKTDKQGDLDVLEVRIEAALQNEFERGRKDAFEEVGIPAVLVNSGIPVALADTLKSNIIPDYFTNYSDYFPEENTEFTPTPAPDNIMEIPNLPTTEDIKINPMIKSLIETLEFYANLDNYDKEDGRISDMKPKGFERKLYKVLDFGDRARAALEKYKKSL